MILKGMETGLKKLIILDVFEVSKDFDSNGLNFVPRKLIHTIHHIYIPLK